MIKGDKEGKKAKRQIKHLKEKEDLLLQINTISKELIKRLRQDADLADLIKYRPPGRG